jgi:hypothetical protein
MMISLSKSAEAKPLVEIEDLTITPGGAFAAQKSEIIFTVTVVAAILGLWIHFA